MRLWLFWGVAMSACAGMAAAGCSGAGVAGGAGPGSSPDDAPPAPPATLTVAADGPYGMTLSWSASSDNVGVVDYGIERCLGAGCSSFEPRVAVAGTSYKDLNLAPSTSYRYRVRARDAMGNASEPSSEVGATTDAAPPPPPVAVPSWVSALSPGEWYEIPDTAMSSIAPSPVPPGASGPASKVIAWTSFAVDTRASMVYSVANGGHSDYAGNEVDRLELEHEAPLWVRRRAPTPAADIVSSATYYADGAPTSRHSYYGMAFNELNDQIVLLGGSRWGNGFGVDTMDSYNITANEYSSAGTHPRLPGSLTGLLAFALASDPATGDLYGFGSYAAHKWTRSINSWSAIGAAGGAPWGFESMSALDSTRGAVLVLGGSSSSHHRYTLATDSFDLVTVTGANAADVNRSQGAMIYVPELDRFLVRFRDAGGTVYQVHPTTFAATAFGTTGGASIPSTQNGPYGKFVYVPRLGGVAYVPTYSGNVWFLRLF